MAILDWFKGLFKGDEEKGPSEDKKDNDKFDGLKDLQDVFSEEKHQSNDFSEITEDQRLTEKVQKGAKGGNYPEKMLSRPERITPITLTHKRKLNICVGLDLGTSSAKTTYRVLGSTEKKVFPLCLNPTNKKTPFLLPSLIAFPDYGKMIFADEAERYLASRPLEEGVRYLKLLFAGQLDSEYHDEKIFNIFQKYCSRQGLADEFTRPDYLLAIFVLGVVKRARGALSEIFPENELNINFNICLPIDSFQKKEMQSGFQRILNAVQDIESKWSIELPLNDMFIQVQSALEGAKGEKNSETRMHLIPEAVAQMASYVTSVSAEQKIHCVIDFGAGTTDFSIFNLVDESIQGRCSYWYNAITYPIGTQRVEGLIDSYYRNKGKTLSHKEVGDILNTGLADKELKKEVKIFLESIWEESRYPVWGKAYAKNRCQGNWTHDQVEVFVCGGGGSLPYVEEIYSKSWYREDWGPYQVKKLLPPADFKVSNMDFSRLSVAYGLSYPEPELNRYVLPKDCEDQTPRKSPVIIEPENQGPVYPDNH